MFALSRAFMTHASQVSDRSYEPRRLMSIIQPSPGTYALLFSSATDQLIRVGQLGSLRLQPGYYVYIGSALGREA